MATDGCTRKRRPGLESVKATVVQTRLPASTMLYSAWEPQMDSSGESESWPSEFSLSHAGALQAARSERARVWQWKPRAQLQLFRVADTVNAGGQELLEMANANGLDG